MSAPGQRLPEMWAQGAAFMSSSRKSLTEGGWVQRQVVAQYPPMAIDLWVSMLL